MALQPGVDFLQIMLFRYDLLHKMKRCFLAGLQVKTIQGKKNVGDRPSCSFIPIKKDMVVRERLQKHRCFEKQSWIELHATKGGFWFFTNRKQQTMFSNNRIFFRCFYKLLLN